MKLSIVVGIVAAALCGSGSASAANAPNSIGAPSPNPTIRWSQHNDPMIRWGRTAGSTIRLGTASREFHVNLHRASGATLLR